MARADSADGAVGSPAEDMTCSALSMIYTWTISMMHIFTFSDYVEMCCFLMTDDEKRPSNMSLKG